MYNFDFVVMSFYFLIYKMMDIVVGVELCSIYQMITSNAFLA